MTEFLSQHVRDGKDVRPQVSLVMNFSKPTANKPSLLTFDEVTTLLHEFGHSLHGMLSRNTYNGTGGTNVYRDFVELPSQIMENWALEKEWLDKWAVHYETGEKIPQEYIEKIRKSANFLSGYLSDRQLSFGMVDMAWHTITAPVTDSIVDFERKAMQPTEIFPDVEGTCFQRLSGIFSEVDMLPDIIVINGLRYWMQMLFRYLRKTVFSMPQRRKHSVRIFWRKGDLSIL